MSLCRTCEYALYDGMCMKQGKFTLLDAPACDDYKMHLDVEVSKLKSENAKLRELCRRFSEYVSHDRCEGCVVKRRCNDGEIDECWQMGDIRKLAHELGIEVDA